MANTRRLRYLLEAAAFYPLWHGVRRLPVDAASRLGGRLARAVGPWLGVHRVAETNLRRAMPELTDAQVRDTLRAMWDNLGRTAFESPHVERFTFWRPRIRIEGAEHLEKIQEARRPVLFVAGHFANWEMAPLLAGLHDMPLALIYRPANNPYVDRLIRRMRAPHSSGLYPKGKAGALHLVRALKRGGHGGMLIDQKMNTGIPVPFFGRDAMTVPAPAELAALLDVPLVPVRIRRDEGARFTAIIHPPMHVTPGTDPATVMATLNTMMEDWVRADPAQWFWVHKRWPKD